jgi:cellulose synthase/poly-beta-1,6-N-acetylglucosamine synthase-like glycosyltransferase
VRPAEKRNLGIAEARGEIIAFVDDDAAPLPGWLRRAALYFGDPQIAGVGGPATTPFDDPYWAHLGGRVYAHPFVSGGYRRRYTPTRVCPEEDIPSCNLLVRTEVLRRLGGFDTAHWPGEDTLLCLRIVHDLKLRLMYDPWVQVVHHRRPLFGPHLRQVGRYALHRGVFARRFPQTSRKVAYMLPSLLLLGLVLGPLVALLHPWLMVFYAAVAGSYAALVLLSSIHPSRPDIWLFTALGVIATHLTYGARFLQGLCGARLPSEVRHFDHQGQAPT